MLSSSHAQRSTRQVPANTAGILWAHPTPTTAVTIAALSWNRAKGQTNMAEKRLIICATWQSTDWPRRRKGWVPAILLKLMRETRVCWKRRIFWWYRRRRDAMLIISTNISSVIHTIRKMRAITHTKTRRTNNISPMRSHNNPSAMALHNRKHFLHPWITKSTCKLSALKITRAKINSVS